MLPEVTRNGRSPIVKIKWYTCLHTHPHTHPTSDFENHGVVYLCIALFALSIKRKIGKLVQSLLMLLADYFSRERKGNERGVF